jgi:phage-related protein
VEVESVNSYIDIDCELQEAYEDTLATPRNDKITLTDGEFPKLLPGVNTISFTDLTELIITPKWWIL